MSGQTGIRNLNGMRGKRKGGLKVVAQSYCPERLTLASHVNRFIAHLAARAYSQGSLDAHHWALKGFLAWADGETLQTPDVFTRAKVEAYQLHLHHYRSPRTGECLVVNTQLARLGCVRRFFAWLCRTGTLPPNPAADLDLPRKQARKLPKSLNEEEIQQLLDLPDPFGLRDRTILELFYATGIRRMEMAQLDLGDFDPSARTLLVRKGKGGKSRLLPVGERASWWLEQYCAESRPLFSHLPGEAGLFLSGYGTRFSPAYLGNWVARLLKKAGMQKTGSCHLFRHSCATDMLEGGADIRYIQEMLGHARLDTTQIYTHVSIRALTEVHARSHPHGRMGDPDSSRNAESRFSRRDDPSVPAPTQVSVISTPIEVACPAKIETRSADNDDLPPESGPPLPPRHPKPSKPGPPSCASGFTQKTDTENGTENHRVTYYGYRYYDPVTGRWPSRDPVGENFATGEINNYVFILNESPSYIDLLGLTIIGGSVDKGRNNCLGGAATDDSGAFFYPDSSKNPNNSFSDAMRKQLEFECKEVKSKADCACKCQEEKILITLYKNNDKKNKGKNPWGDPAFDWGDRSGSQSDIHAIRAKSGCSNYYKQVPHTMPGKQGQDNFDTNIDWDLFKGTPLLCCCRKKS